MKKFLAFIVLVSCVFFGLSHFSDDSVDAAGKTMYINAKSDVILREKPVKDGKQIGTIKNGTAVTVLSSSKGWSNISVGKKKGYVYTSVLSDKKPVPPVVKDGLIPKAGLTLTYNPSITGMGEKETFKVTAEKGKRVLSTTTKDGDNLAYSEANGRLTLEVVGQEWNLFSFGYPMTHGSTTKAFYESMGEEGLQKYTVKIFVDSTNSTLKTPAGTFSNVVILRNEDGFKYYLAKGYGLLKIEDSVTGEVMMELVSVK